MPSYTYMYIKENVTNGAFRYGLLFLTTCKNIAIVNTFIHAGMPEVAERMGCNWLTRGHTP